MDIAPITARERAQIDAANAADGAAVVLIHGPWTLAETWGPWQERLAARGFPSVAVEWPGEPESVEAARRAPDAIPDVGLKKARDHLMLVIRALSRTPYVVGHSIGGLLAQQVAGKGLARATVAIAPAPMQGATPAPTTVLFAAAPVTGDRGNIDRIVRWSYEDFRHVWAGSLDADEARRLWETVHVAAPARAMFELGASWLGPRPEATVDTVNPDRGPLLIVGAGQDALVVPALASATFRIQSRNPSPTDFVEFSDRGHTLVFDHGWAEVADRVVEYLERQRSIA